MNNDIAQDLRHAALIALAVRHPSALTTPQLRRAVAKEFPEPFTDPQLESALEFLKSSKYAAVDFDALGSTPYWSATHDGVLYFERNLR